MGIHEQYMSRCLDLAGLGAGYVAPNPMVGAVLVHENRIIGEGYHQQYGGPHAEVNCIRSVAENDRELISRSVLYVSLEPCAHFGKTPPCADLIIASKIPRVVIACRDPFPEVNGKGIERLRDAGVNVELGVLEREATELNKRFFTFHIRQRPYIILKWAQTSDRRIGYGTAQRMLISNEYTQRLVHRWRTEEAAILVGTSTAMLDDPSLTARFWPGNHPVRLVIDRSLKLPGSLNLFDRTVPTIVFNTIRNEERDGLFFVKLHEEKDLILQMMDELYTRKLSSVIVEGGAALISSFLRSGIWDEIRVIENTAMLAGEGLFAPDLPAVELMKEIQILTDRIRYFRPTGQP